MYGALRGHLCDSTAILFGVSAYVGPPRKRLRRRLRPHDHVDHDYQPQPVDNL